MTRIDLAIAAPPGDGPGFTCECNNPVEVTRRVGGTVLIWHRCTAHSIGINAQTEAQALSLWTAERQRSAR